MNTLDNTSNRLSFAIIIAAKKNSHALYGGFLEAGIEIHQYRRSIMHAKVAVIDEHWATVGSSNLDPFSLLLSLEANVVVDDESFAKELKHSLKPVRT